MYKSNYLDRFEAGTLPPAGLRHADHVGAAWRMLAEHPPLEALARYCAGIRKLALAAGKPGLYHETITWAYVLLIRERRARLPAGHSWADFAAANPDLLQFNPGVLDRLYARETLASEFARGCFVLPDRLRATETRATP
jgi:hypothetical protein